VLCRHAVSDCGGVSICVGVEFVGWVERLEEGADEERVRWERLED